MTKQAFRTRGCCDAQTLIHRTPEGAAARITELANGTHCDGSMDVEAKTHLRSTLGHWLEQAGERESIRLYAGGHTLYIEPSPLVD